MSVSLDKPDYSKQPLRTIGEPPMTPPAPNLSTRFKDSTSKLFPRHYGSSGSNSSNSTTSPPKSRTDVSRKQSLSESIATTALAKPSRELERIATSIKGSPSALLPLNSSSRDDKHKYHHPFKTPMASILSSSSSNSKLTSEQGSIYTFNSSTANGRSMIRTPPALEVGGSAMGFLSSTTRGVAVLPSEDNEFVAKETLTLLEQWILPLFNGEGLRTPVEKVNFLVTLHIESRKQQGYIAKDLLQEFKHLTQTGMARLADPFHKVLDSKLLARMVDLWQFFFSQVLPYWEAVFLPMQLEFEGKNSAFWAKLTTGPDYEQLNINRLTLIAFRDIVVLPIASRIEAIIGKLLFDFEESSMSMADVSVKLLQCTNVLATIRSGDENQEKVQLLIQSMKRNWLNRPQIDRRGLVFNKADQLMI
ncbi:hypothetical protein DV452_002698 [Geotrichum candidum]|nr:hypothetical protein DV454_003702 [Geotrichum candidum]KAF5116320.1 hypothetical protein DV452_002698 [Geotrichum candidum]